MVKFSKTIKQVIGAVALTAAAASANAATVQAGGIQWDTIGFGGGQGMEGKFSFQQWFTNGVYGTGADGQKIIDATTGNLPLGVGGVLSGVGTFTGLSDGRNAFVPSFCVAGPGTCELTVAFGGLVATSPTTFDFSNAWLNVYYDLLDTPFVADFGWSVSSTSYQNYEAAQNGTLWASFEFDSFSFDGVGLESGNSRALLSIVGGVQDVIDALDVNDGSVGDLLFTASSQFLGQNFSVASTGEVTTVSAPSTIAIFGLSLIGLGAVARRRTK